MQNWSRYWTLYGRTVSLLLAMVIGAVCPWAHALSDYLQYLLMIMLFFAFLDITLTRESFHISLLWVLLANIVLPFVWFLLFNWFQPDIALVAFLTAATPTATATPVIVGFLEGKVEYVVAAVFLTNIGMALLLPFFLPWVVGSAMQVTTAALLPPVLQVMFVPLVLSWLARRLPEPAIAFVRRGKPLAFPTWLGVLFLVTSKASYFIQNNLNAPISLLLEIAAVSLLVCILNFAIGAWLGGRDFRKEASQALGQKNNSFTVWLAIAFLNPLTALGPTFYVAYHNVYNAAQLYLHERSRHSP